MAEPMNIKEKAEQALIDSGFRAAPINPEKVAEALNVDVQFFDEPDTADHFMRQVAGFYDFDKQKIFVNNSLSVPDMAFTIAHELGHHILHQDWVQGSDYMLLLKENMYESAHNHPLEEQQADAFARFLLVPESAVNLYGNLLSEKELASFLVVRPSVLKKRLSHSG